MEVHHDSLLRSYSLPNLASSCPCLLHHRHHPCPHVTRAETRRQNKTTVTSSGRKNLSNKENNNEGDKKQEEQEASFDKKRLIPSCLPLHTSPLVSSSSLQPSPVSVVSLQKEQVLQEQYNNVTSVNLFSHLNFLQDSGEEEGKHSQEDSLPLDSRDVSTTREPGISSTSSTASPSCIEGNNNYCNVCCHSMRKSSLQSTIKMKKKVHPQDLTEEEDQVNRNTTRRMSHEEEPKQEQEENEVEPVIVILDKQEDEVESDEIGCRCSCNTSISTCVEGTQHTHHHNRLQKILQRTHGQHLHHHQQHQAQNDSLRQSLISFLKTSSLVSRSKEVCISSTDKDLDRHRRTSLIEQSLMMKPSTSLPDAVATTQDEALLDSQEDSSHDSDSDPDDYDDNDDNFQELYFPDDLILKELSEMRFLLKTLLEQNLELARITLPLTSTDDILSTVLGLTSSSLSGNLGTSLGSSRGTNAILFPDFAESNQASSSHGE